MFDIDILCINCNNLIPSSMIEYHFYLCIALINKFCKLNKVKTFQTGKSYLDG